MKQIKNISNQIVRPRIAGLLMLAVLVVTMLGSVGATATTTPEFKYFKLIQVPGIDQEQLLYVPLDREIFKYCNADMSDIRLFDSKKNEVPGLLEQRFTGSDDSSTRKPAEKKYPVKSFETSRSDDGKTVIDLVMSREPLVGFEVTSDPITEPHGVTIQAQLDGKWVGVGSGDIGTLATAETPITEAFVAIEPTRSLTYRITIDNDDTASISLQQIQGVGLSYQMVFIATPKSAYQLFWGSDTVTEPPVGSDEITRLIDRKSPAKRARSGRGFTNPDFGTETTKPAEESFMNSKAFFAIIVLLIVLVLGSALMRAVKRDQK